MQTKDYKVLGITLAAAALFCLTPGALDGFIAVTTAYPYSTSFLKFAVLATFGECIGLRITSGVYYTPEFGVLPKALVWGLLGMGIKAAFTIFVTGAPNVPAELGLPLSAAMLKTGDFFQRLCTAFFISVTINCIFAPIFMTLHKITDVHIAAARGSLPGSLRPIPMGAILKDLNWNALWGFVFKKTIPFFWIPAHTVTFLLPAHFQVVFAALLGIVLGVILAVSNRQSVRLA